MMMRSILTALWLAVAVFANPGWARAEPQSLRVERVVLLMRHGIRPPTKPDVTPPGVAAEAWPAWTTPFGELTAHGYAAIRLLGAYDRAALAHDKVLPATRCPTPGDLVVWSDSDQRTIRTGDALIEGLAPGCGVANGHRAQDTLDPLFSPLDVPGAIDTAKAQAEILATVGSLDAVRAARRTEFIDLSRILGCCTADKCASAVAGPCTLADMPSSFAAVAGRPKLAGPMDFGPTAAQSIMLAYVEGMPLAQVGWGRASRTDIERIMGLHSMKGEVLQRPLYVAARGAGPLADRMLAALNGDGAENGKRVTILVGHDTNISDLSGVLDATWRVASYPANTPPPGGGLGLQLLRDAEGQRFVRAFYRSQTMAQMRALSPLSLRAPPSTQWVTIGGCGRGEDPISCPLNTFEALVRARLAATVD